ncbi:MAG: ribosome silencing factor [Bacteriovoracaceae bacterium]
MANEFVQNEVNKIFEPKDGEKKDEKSKKMALACAWIIANYKGVNIKIFDVGATSALCDYNIIATAQNITQAKTMIDEIQYSLKRHGAKVLSLEGVTDGDWMLLDAADVIVHIFQDVARDVFDLDSLWADYPQLEIPQEYYFERSEVKAKTDPTDNYF